MDGLIKENIQDIKKYLDCKKIKFNNLTYKCSLIRSKRFEEESQIKY